MLQGKSISQVAAQVLAESKLKKDYLVASSAMAMEEVVGLGEKQPPGFALAVGDQRLGFSEVAREQMAGYLQIPKTYWDRVATVAPDLLPTSVNRLLRAMPTTDRRLVRTYPGVARAILSDRYRRLDNDDVATHVLPVLIDGGFEIVSAEVTERRLYIHALSPKLTYDVKVGDPVNYGLLISNSEVGVARLAMEGFLNRLKCTNGMLVRESIARRHVGAKTAWDDLVGDDGQIKDDTAEAQDRALWLTMRDGIAAMTAPERVKALVGRIGEEGARPVNLPAAEAVVELKRYGLRESESEAVLEGFIKEGDRTLWGLANAVTAVANTVTDYDRGVELEALGGKIVSLPSTEYRRMAA